MRSILFILFAFGYSSFAQDKLVPASYEPIKEISGDLDKDGIAEKVVVYNMKDTVDENDGNIREIIIFKKEKSDWVIWQRSTHAVLSSRAGFLGENAFQDIEIVKGILIISHSSGGRWKWFNTDKYRYQNNAFELIGFTCVSGTPCEYWLDIDYNLSTHAIDIKKEYERCENKEQVISKRENEKFVHHMKEKKTLNNRYDAEVEITSPKYKHQFYL